MKLSEEELAVRSIDMADQILSILRGHDPELVGWVLADALAGWIAGFQLLGETTPVDIEKAQSVMLDLHIHLVRKLIPDHREMFDKELARGEITRDMIKQYEP
jgi:hypothetical protein